MLPPTIPTSFIPHSASVNARRSGIGPASIFSFFSYTVIVAVFALAIGVFFYGRILAADESTKSAALAKAEANINPATVESFVRLRDRLISGEKLLAGHIAFSGFLTSLGGLMPTTVRFSSLHLSIDDNGTIKFEGSGTAKSFNALAAASIGFARDGRIKDAIFSNIKVEIGGNSVSFALSATLDPKIVSFSPNASVTSQNAPAATSSEPIP